MMVSKYNEVPTMVFSFFSVVVQHVSWQGNQFISAKKRWSKNESINLFEQTSVKFSLKNNATLLHWCLLSRNANMILLPSF